jgi:hypothetical protein
MVVVVYQVAGLKIALRWKERTSRRGPIVTVPDSNFQQLTWQTKSNLQQRNFLRPSKISYCLG